MSLPSTACLIKNGNIVASVMINIGWFVTETGIIDCCYEAYNSCLVAEAAELEELPKWPIAYLVDEWKSFDHILLYDHIIPRFTLDEYYLGKISRDEFTQRFKDGSYNRNGNRWINHNKSMIEDFHNKKEAKYGKL